jgi:hypothetical protein
VSASIEVTAPITEGSIVVLRDVEFDGDVMVGLVEQMAELVGHKRFLVVCVAGGGELETWGPDTDLGARVTELFDEARAQRPTPPPRPGSNAGWQGGRGRRPEPPPKS